MPNRLKNALERLAKSRKDPLALTDMYTAMWPWVFSLMYREMRGSRELAEDASQDVFIKLILYCPFIDLQDPDAFRAYVWTVCKNVSRTSLNRMTRLSETELFDVHEGPMRRHSVIDSSDKDLRDIVEEVLGSLDNTDRRLLRNIVEGYSLKEIADQSGITYSNAAIRVHRLRKRLRAYLARRQTSQSE